MTRKVTLGRGPKGAVTAWRDRVPFDCNDTLSGEYMAYVSSWDSGRLNAEMTAHLVAYGARALKSGTKLYVVRSYATPIAWIYTTKAGKEHVFYVSQKFSVTTTRHQSQLY